MEVVCISSRRLCHGDLLTRLERVSRSGVESVYLREKDLAADEYRTLLEGALRVCTCDVYAVRYVDVARSLHVQNVHLSYREFLEEHHALGDFRNVSVSVHSVEEAREAQRLGATRIVTGHVFATDCKKGLPPRGLDYLRTICESVEVPVYAIGGVTAQNAPSVLESGATGVCAMSSLMQAPDVEILIETLKEINF